MTVSSRKQAGCKKPVGENREAAAASPQLFKGVPAGTMRGRSVGVEKSKLRSSPVMMLNGLPDTASIMGATVQLLNNLPAKLSPTRPLWYTPLKTKRWRWSNSEFDRSAFGL